MSNVPPVDWGALKPEAQVHRSYRGPETEVGPIEWACPACGEKNQTPLAQGCGHCGSGKPGQHVGVDPVVTPEERARRLQQEGMTAVSPEQRQQQYGNRLQATTATEEMGAFLEWYMRAPRPADSHTLALEAFCAGWRARGLQVPDDNATPRTTHRLVDPDEPLPVPPPAPSVGGESEGAAAGDTATFVGTAVQRTTLAALIFFRDQIYTEQPEEVTTGEWITLAHLNSEIAYLQEALK